MSTAETVLMGVWLTVCDKKLAVPPDLSDYTRQMAAATGSPLFQLLKFRLIRWFAHRQESRILPGVCAHYAARKAEIQRVVEAIDNPVLVVLGAGFDGLAYRLALAKTVVELDRAEMQLRKQRLLEQLPPRPMGFVAASLPAGDIMPSFTDATTYVAEGVFMYLSEAEVEQVLSELPKDCSLVFTFVGLDEKGRPAMGSNQAQVDKMLATMDEPFRWGYRPDHMASFLYRNGFGLFRILGTGFEEVNGMVSGEWIASANKL